MQKQFDDGNSGAGLVCKNKVNAQRRIWKNMSEVKNNRTETIRSNNRIDFSTFSGCRIIPPPFRYSSIEIAGYESKKWTSSNNNYIGLVQIK